MEHRDKIRMILGILLSALDLVVFVAAVYGIYTLLTT